MPASSPRGGTIRPHAPHRTDATHGPEDCGGNAAGIAWPARPDRGATGVRPCGSRDRRRRIGRLSAFAVSPERIPNAVRVLRPDARRLRTVGRARRVRQSAAGAAGAAASLTPARRIRQTMRSTTVRVRRGPLGIDSWTVRGWRVRPVAQRLRGVPCDHCRVRHRFADASVRSSARTPWPAHGHGHPSAGRRHGRRVATNLDSTAPAWCGCRSSRR